MSPEKKSIIERAELFLNKAAARRLEAARAMQQARALKELAAVLRGPAREGEGCGTQTSRRQG